MAFNSFPLFACWVCEKVFTIDAAGHATSVVGGCLVTLGEIEKDSLVRVIRNEEKVWEGKIANLRSFKRNVSSVPKGFISPRYRFQVGLWVVDSSFAVCLCARKRVRNRPRRVRAHGRGRD